MSLSRAREDAAGIRSLLQPTASQLVGERRSLGPDRFCRCSRRHAIKIRVRGSVKKHIVRALSSDESIEAVSLTESTSNIQRP